MGSLPLFIAHPSSLEEINILKAFVKALKIKYEVTPYEKPYNENFVNNILEAEKNIEQGKGLNLTSEEFDQLWK